jgi:hypothetical protein
MPVTSARRAPDDAYFVGIKTYFSHGFLRELITIEHLNSNVAQSELQSEPFF